MQTTELRTMETFSARVELPHDRERWWLRQFQANLSDDVALPMDPRHWSREDVAKWLLYMTRRHNLVDVRSERFLMNGKALCLMNLNMFLTRVPVGGKLLYKDFQIRLGRAMHANDSD